MTALAALLLIWGLACCALAACGLIVDVLDRRVGWRE